MFDKIFKKKKKEEKKETAVECKIIEMKVYDAPTVDKSRAMANRKLNEKKEEFKKWLETITRDLPGKIEKEYNEGKFSLELIIKKPRRFT